MDFAGTSGLTTIKKKTEKEKELERLNKIKDGIEKEEADIQEAYRKMHPDQFSDSRVRCLALGVCS